MKKIPKNIDAGSVIFKTTIETDNFSKKINEISKEFLKIDKLGDNFSKSLNSSFKNIESPKIKIDIDAQNFNNEVKNLNKIKTENIKIEADLKNDNFNSELKTIQNNLKNVDAKIKTKLDTSNLKSELDAIKNKTPTDIKTKLQLDFNEFKNNLNNFLKKTENDVKNSSQKMKFSFADAFKFDFVSKATTGALSIVRGATNSLQNFLKAGFEFNAQQERDITTFTTKLKDRSRAVEEANRTVLLAEKTPFGIEDINKAKAQLISFDFAGQELEDTLIALGDASFGNAEVFKANAYSLKEMYNQGKATTQSLKEMITKGFNPLEEIVKKTGETMPEVQKRVEKGAVSFDELLEAIKNASKEGGAAFGGMEAQSKTALGLLSTLSDQRKKLAGALTTTVFLQVQNLLPQVTKSLDAVNKAFGGLDINKPLSEQKLDFSLLQETLKTEIEKLLPEIENVLNQLIPQIQGVFQAIAPIFGTIFETAKPYLEAALQKFLEWLGPALVKLFILAFNGLSTVIGEALASVLPGTGEFYEIFGKIGLAIGLLIKAIPFLVSAFNILKVAVSVLALALRGLFALFLSNPLGLFITAIGLFITLVITAYKKSEDFRNIVNLVFTVLKQTAVALWNFNKAIFSAIINLFVDVGKKLINFVVDLKNLGKKFIDIGKEIVNGIWDGIKSNWDNLKNKFKEKFNELVGFTKDFFKIKSPSRLMAKEIGEPIAQGIGIGISNSSSLQFVKKSFETLLNEFNAQSKEKFKKVDLKLNLNSEDLKNQFDELLNKQKDLITNYQNELQNKSNQIYSSFNLFDSLNANAKESKQNLQQNLQEQIDALKQYSYDIGTIAEKGVSKDFLKELSNLGVGAREQINKLSKMTESELKNYEDLWREKLDLSNVIATKELQPFKIDTENTINEINEEAEKINNKLQQVAKETEKNNPKITVKYEKKSFNDIVKEIQKDAKDKLKNLGINLNLKANVEELQTQFKTIVDKSKEIVNNYQNELKSRSEQIASSFNLFAKADKKEITENLKENLQSQIDVLNSYSKSFDVLKEKGVSKILLDELKKLGVNSAAEIENLSKMTDAELKNYEKLFLERQNLSKQIATKELQPLKFDTKKNIEELDKNLILIEQKLKESSVPLVAVAEQTGTAIGETLSNNISYNFVEEFKIVDTAKDFTGNLATNILKYDWRGLGKNIGEEIKSGINSVASSFNLKFDKNQNDNKNPKDSGGGNRNLTPSQKNDTLKNISDAIFS